MSDEELFEGGCLCGKIRYAVRGTLDAAESVARPGYAIWAAHALPWLGELCDIPSYPGSLPPDAAPH